MTNTLEVAWRRQIEWSHTADRLKYRLVKWRLRVLSLEVIAAVAGTACGLPEVSASLRRWLSIVATGAAASSPVIAQFQLGSRRVGCWIRSRSASEAYKCEVFQYRTGTGPYRGSGRAGVLTEAMRQIESSVSDVLKEGAGENRPQVADLSDLSIDQYIDERALEQVRAYYVPKSEVHAKTARRYRVIHFALLLFGAVLTALSAFADFGDGFGPSVLS